MNLNRLLVTQAAHAASWGIPAGQFAMVVQCLREPRAYPLGSTIEANVIGFRPTILRTDQPCSTSPAVEKYHDPSSFEYKRLQLELQCKHANYWQVFEGVELLLAFHGQHSGLATILMKGHTAIRSFRDFCGKGGMFSPKPERIARFYVEEIHGRSWSWNTFVLGDTRDEWKRLSVWSREVHRFNEEAGGVRQAQANVYQMVDRCLHPRHQDRPSKTLRELDEVYYEDFGGIDHH